MKYFLFSVFLVILLMMGCSRDSDQLITPNLSGSGNIVLKIDRANKPQSVVALEAILSRPPNDTISQFMNLLSDSSADLTFNDIPVGTWRLKVNAYDSLNLVIYSGEADVNIQAGITVQVNLTLLPTSSGYGNIYIYVTWGTAGQKWRIIPSGTNSNLQSIFFINSNIGWCVGENGTILKSSDGGNHWYAQNSQTGYRINWIHFIDQDKGFAVGQNGVFLKTSDGGDNWSSVYPNSYFLNSLYHIFFYEQTGWIVGSSGMILKTSDLGATWYNKEIPMNYSFFSSYFLNQNTGFVVGQSGLIIKTTDGGATWYNSGSNYNWQWLQSVKFVSSNTGIAVGGLGSIIKTTNGGSSWYSVMSGTTEHFEDLFFTNYTDGWAVGDHGTIKKTNDAGSSWLSEVKITNSWLNGTFFISENMGWAVGNNGIILKYQN